MTPNSNNGNICAMNETASFEEIELNGDYTPQARNFSTIPAAYGAAVFLDVDAFVNDREEFGGLSVWETVDVSVRVGPKGGIQFIHVDSTHCVSDWSKGVPMGLLVHKRIRLLEQDGPTKDGETLTFDLIRGSPALGWEEYRTQVCPTCDHNDLVPLYHTEDDGYPVRAWCQFCGTHIVYHYVTPAHDAFCGCPTCAVDLPDSFDVGSIDRRDRGDDAQSTALPRWKGRLWETDFREGFDWLDQPAFVCSNCSGRDDPLGGGRCMDCAENTTPIDPRPAAWAPRDYSASLLWVEMGSDFVTVFGTDVPVGTLEPLDDHPSVETYPFTFTVVGPEAPAEVWVVGHETIDDPLYLITALDGTADYDGIIVETSIGFPFPRVLGANVIVPLGGEEVYLDWAVTDNLAHYSTAYYKAQMEDDDDDDDEVAERVFRHPTKGTVYLRHDFDGRAVTEWCTPGGYPYVTKGHSSAALALLGYVEEN
jgi:hypothetical protein